MKKLVITKFHDATEPDATMMVLNDYEIDWERTAVVYRSGKGQSIIVTCKGEHFKVNKSILTLLNNLRKKHCIRGILNEPVKQIYRELYDSKERLSETYIMGMNKMIPYKDKNAPDAGYFMAHHLCELRELEDGSTILVFYNGLQVKVPTSYHAVSRQLAHSDKLAQIQLDVFEHILREAGLAADKHHANCERIRVAAALADKFIQKAVLENFKLGHRLAYSMEPDAQSMETIKKEFFKKK